ncbi:hypothetical protein [Streptomyces tritici]|uniref:hypothetical protein n=1 Tax=Streptomyces tritici TaxID=2054410 RepID=UPI003AEF4489
MLDRLGFCPLRRPVGMIEDASSAGGVATVRADSDGAGAGGSHRLDLGGAGRRAANGDHRTAYARYERRMCPFVALNEALATENPGGPASEESVTHANSALSLDG